MDTKIVNWLASHLYHEYLEMWMYEDDYHTANDARPAAEKEIGDNVEARIPEEYDRTAHVTSEGVYNIYISPELFDAAWAKALELEAVAYGR